MGRERGNKRALEIQKHMLNMHNEVTPKMEGFFTWLSKSPSIHTSSSDGTKKERGKKNQAMPYMKD